MAFTVQNAFSTFLQETVRIKKTRSDIAKISKENLVKEIAKFPDDGIFPKLHDMLSIDYGSFSRKTKIQPLDDIDLMIVLHAQGATYDEHKNPTQVFVNNEYSSLKKFCNDYTSVLNSTKVLNGFKDYLGKVSKYKKAEIKKNQEAVTLNLESYEWVFDIVPCFITNTNPTEQSLFLIPDGVGNWKKTDPRIDKQRTLTINQAHSISVIDVIRLFKFWTNRATMPTMKSYFLENLILNYYDLSNSTGYIDLEVRDVLAYINQNIQNPLYDPKGFQGDINHLTYDERNKIQNKTHADYQIALEARKLESQGNIKESIKKWGEIFGDQFPSYG